MEREHVVTICELAFVGGHVGPVSPATTGSPLPDGLLSDSTDPPLEGQHRTRSQKSPLRASATQKAAKAEEGVTLPGALWR